MERWDKVESVQRMQDYIRVHVWDEIFDFEALYAHAGYSRRHAERIFKELLGKTIKEYILCIRLSDSSKKLLEKKENILEIALDTKFRSHEGYSRAFFERFGWTPNAYRHQKPPIPLFVPYSVKHQYLYEKGEIRMKDETTLCMILPVQRPKRKLLFFRSRKATDYWSYCEEVGCDWEGMFNSVAEKLDTAALLELPPCLQKEGFSSIAAGIEVPLEYQGTLPGEWEAAELEPCEMMVFQSGPYENEEDFCVALGHVCDAMEKCDLKAYGYEGDDTLAPRFNYGAEAKKGAKIAIPVRRI